MNWQLAACHDCVLLQRPSKQIIKKTTVTEKSQAWVRREPTYLGDVGRLLALKASCRGTEIEMEQETVRVLMRVLASRKSVLATVVIPATEVPPHRPVTHLAMRRVADTFAVQFEDKAEEWLAVAESGSTQLVYTVSLEPAVKVWRNPRR